MNVQDIGDFDIDTYMYHLEHVNADKVEDLWTCIIGTQNLGDSPNRQCITTDNVEQGRLLYWFTLMIHSAKYNALEVFDDGDYDNIADVTKMVDKIVEMKDDGKETLLYFADMGNFETPALQEEVSELVNALNSKGYGVLLEFPRVYYDKLNRGTEQETSPEFPVIHDIDEPFFYDEAVR